MERARSGSVVPAVAGVAAAGVELVREVRLDIVGPDTWDNGSIDRKYRVVRKEADLEAEDFHLHHLHL